MASAANGSVGGKEKKKEKISGHGKKQTSKKKSGFSAWGNNKKNKWQRHVQRLPSLNTSKGG